MARKGQQGVNRLQARSPRWLSLLVAVALSGCGDCGEENDAPQAGSVWAIDYQMAAFVHGHTRLSPFMGDLPVTYVMSNHLSGLFRVGTLDHDSAEDYFVTELWPMSGRVDQTTHASGGFATYGNTSLACDPGYVHRTRVFGQIDYATQGLSQGQYEWWAPPNYTYLSSVGFIPAGYAGPSITALFHFSGPWDLGERIPCTYTAGGTLPLHSLLGVGDAILLDVMPAKTGSYRQKRVSDAPVAGLPHYVNKTEYLTIRCVSDCGDATPTPPPMPPAPPPSPERPTVQVLPIEDEDRKCDAAAQEVGCLAAVEDIATTCSELERWVLIYGREDGEQHVFCSAGDCGGPPDQLRATRDRWVGIDYVADYSCGTGEQIICRIECYGDLP